MQLNTPHPAPNQAEPHPAVLLGEAVAGLLACLLAPWGLWRLMPGGRALHAMLTQWGRDFAALMQRLAALPPTPATPAPIPTRTPRPAADPRPKTARAPSHRTPRARRTTAPRQTRVAPRRTATAFPPPLRDQPVLVIARPRPLAPWPRAGPPKTAASTSASHALFVPISKL